MFSSPVQIPLVFSQKFWTFDIVHIHIAAFGEVAGLDVWDKSFLMYSLVSYNSFLHVSC